MLMDQGLAVLILFSYNSKVNKEPMNHTRTTYIFLAVIGILMYNTFLIHRDNKLMKAYDAACAQQPHNPNCIYAK